MDKKPIIGFPYLRNIGLFLTYKCQVACPHCLVEAGPHRKEVLEKKKAFEWINQIAAYRNGFVKIVSLTGGEPFYDLDLLQDLSDYAAKKNLYVSAVTNAYWAKTKDTALETLKSTPNVRMISISTDSYHLQSIPFERIENAIYAAKNLKLPYSVVLCTEDKEDQEYKRILDRLYHLTEEEKIITAITFRVGRAETNIDNHQYKRSKLPPVSACTASSSPIIFPDGRVIACVGPVINLKGNHPLVLGNLNEKDLCDILNEAELDPLIHTLRVWGPKKLISLIKQNGFEGNLPQTYIEDSICPTCFDLMVNEHIAKYLSSLRGDMNFIRKVAYARLYYLNEDIMVNILHEKELL